MSIRRDDLDDLERGGREPASTLIELGAGTGLFAVAASPNCKRVIAVMSARDGRRDPGESRRAKARRTSRCLAGFLSYEHHGAPADFIYTRNAVNHLPDFWKGIALERMAGVLAPGGTLRLRDLVFSFDLPEAEEARIANWLDTAAEEVPRSDGHGQLERTSATNTAPSAGCSSR